MARTWYFQTIISVGKTSVREGFIQKKKVENFLYRGGGQDKIFSISPPFYFFLNVLIHANMQRKFFFIGGGTPF